MAKTVNDYMNDPRILEDSEMMEAPECIREIHAIRLMLQDETAGMTTEEHVNYVNRKAEAFMEKHGLMHLYLGSEKKESKSPQTAISEPIMA
jgi:hypothetical protein